MMTKELTPPLKWHGGKYYLARKIIDLMPPHLHYVEPYFGGGQVLFARDPNRNWLVEKPGEKLPAALRGCSEVVNDINGDLMNFWHVLQSPETSLMFQRDIYCTPFSEQEFNNYFFVPPVGAVAQAVRFFIRYRQSRQGLGKDFATLSRNRTRRGMNEQVSAWLNVIEGLPEIHERLQSVVILNRNALDVIKSQDGQHTLFYLDPPYLHESRVTTDSYEYEMTPEHHRQLLETLADIQGKFILSGYPVNLYSAYEVQFGWRHVDFKIDNKASGKKKKEIKTERVWMNY